ncbi:hypothetical protein [Marivita hallyeonensis]|uniref:Uncharacterized protein n=1 Tax=Marivita hallyeonensis TaxID=996342 RepID=A0A1M5MWV7_9RHOB|nr:hypothetical protein [Marivita hallyeonensis]SHG81830.1 hypothetical protein SAMN05443551_0688 [Marivita hallyeonensis]
MKLCKIVVGLFAALWVFAIVVLLIGQFGLFGQERDPLSGIFLMPLGLPWNRLIDAAPEGSWPWLAALAPLINLVLLSAICRFLGNRAVK